MKIGSFRKNFKYKLKLEKNEEELNTVNEKLEKEEDKAGDLKIELKPLQKEFDAKTSQYQRELNRTKLANEKVISYFVFEMFTFFSFL